MPKRLCLLLAVAALAATAIAVTPAASQEAPTVEPATLADDTLREAVAALESGREAGTEVEMVDGRARVEILHHRDTATITNLVETVGGEVYGDVPGVLVEGLVPWEALGGMEASEEIDFIRTPEVISQPIVESTDAGASSSAEFGYASEELRKTRADTWHQAGHRGEGTRIGIVDVFSNAAWRRAARNGEVPQNFFGSFCEINGDSCSIWNGDSPHGVAVTEVVADMAPYARISPIRVETASDLQEAVEWSANADVDVLTRSLTSPYDGPGDGSGTVATIIDNAVAEGITFVQAAGNASGGTAQQPGSYLRWTFADADNDGWVEFAPGDERLTVGCGYQNGLRWDDFGEGAGATDYDLYVYNGNGTVLSDTSDDRQPAGAPPIERTADCTTTRNQVAVKLVTPGDPTAAGDVLEFLMNGVEFERWTNPGSASGPGADTASPGALTVGAIDPWNGTTAGYYSSQGPTNDGRVKPDITAPSCVASVVTTPSCFNGTSAAAPVVAGAAALYVETDPTATPQEVADWLKAQVIDRGPAGPDNRYGAGELLLPSMGPRPRYRPDARIASTPNGLSIGNNIYNASGARQSQTQRVRGRWMVPFFVRLENDGNAAERFVILGPRSAFGFRLKYYWGIEPYLMMNPGITSSIVNGTYRTVAEVDPGEHVYITVQVVVPPHPQAGGIRGAIQVVSASNFSATDTVGFTAQLP